MKKTLSAVTMLNAVTLGTKICRGLDGAHASASHSDNVINQEALERTLTSKILARVASRKEK